MLQIDDFVNRNFPEAELVNNDYHVNCPFCLGRMHSYDDKAHLYVSVVKQAAHCFRCGYTGSWIALVMNYMGVRYYQALNELYSVPKLEKFKDVDKLLTTSKDRKHAKLPNLPDDFTRLYSNQTLKASPYVRYLQRRGIKAFMIKKHDIGYADSIPLRVIIPIENGYYQARAITAWMTPKYLNPIASAADVLFNADAMKLYDEIVICEGAFSAMAVGENALALISKEATPERLERILASDVGTFIIALEPDAFGTMGKLADSLYSNGRKVIIWNYSKGDPADSDSEFEELVYSIKTKIMLSLT